MLFVSAAAKGHLSLKMCVITAHVSTFTSYMDSRGICCLPNSNAAFTFVGSRMANYSISFALMGDFTLSVIKHTSPVVCFPLQ